MSDINERGCLVVGEGVSITGTLSIPGKLTIDGQIDGDISANEVQVGESGKITGKLSVAIADVRGELVDSISVAEMLILRGTAKVRGNVVYNTLQIEQGAVIEGTLSRTSSSHSNFGTASLSSSTSESFEPN